MNWYVYILELSDGTYYTGTTNNLSRRMKLHESGRGSKYVRSRLPLKIVYTEEFENRSLACKRECKIKKLSRNEKILLIKSV
jgi:putative endonuclease